MAPLMLEPGAAAGKPPALLLLLMRPTVAPLCAIALRLSNVASSRTAIAAFSA